MRDHVTHLHIKDGVFADGGMRYTFPGEGQGDVERILADALARGYDGFISIEPHLSVVHHDPTITGEAAIRLANYVEYGRRTAALVERLRAAVP